MHPEVKLKAGYNGDSISPLENTKNSGVSISNLKNDKERSVPGINGLQVSQTEFVWWSLKLPCIMTSFDFVHAPSVFWNSEEL